MVIVTVESAKAKIIQQEEVKRIYDTLKTSKTNILEFLDSPIYEFKFKNKTLALIGITHERANKDHEAITKEIFEKINPQILIEETPKGNPENLRLKFEDKENWSISEYITNYANERDIKVEGSDLNVKKILELIIKYDKSDGFPLAVFWYFTGSYNSLKAIGKSKEDAFNKAVERTINAFLEGSLKEYAESFKQLLNQYPSDTNFKSFINAMNYIASKYVENKRIEDLLELNLQTPYPYMKYKISEVNLYVEAYRDYQMLKTILEALENNDKLMVVLGIGHVMELEEILKNENLLEKFGKYEKETLGDIIFK